MNIYRWICMCAYINGLIVDDAVLMHVVELYPCVCVCMCVRVHLYAYICICIYMYIYRYACVYIYMS